MKKIVWKYGIISGIILSGIVVSMMMMMGNSNDFRKGESFGYFFMIAAFSVIFFGVRDRRDNRLGGVITFRQAFRTGLLITLIAATCYVITWLVYFNFIDDSFTEKYTSYQIEQIRQQGKSVADTEKEIADFRKNMQEYRNPLVMAFYTFLEVFPIGLMVTIICAMLMRRKPSVPQS